MAHAESMVDDVLIAVLEFARAAGGTNLAVCGRARVARRESRWRAHAGQARATVRVLIFT
jgi:hypothetical protein